MKKHRNATKKNSSKIEEIMNKQYAELLKDYQIFLESEYQSFILETKKYSEKLQAHHREVKNFFKSKKLFDNKIAIEAFNIDFEYQKSKICVHIECLEERIKLLEQNTHLQIFKEWLEKEIISPNLYQFFYNQYQVQQEYYLKFKELKNQLLSLAEALHFIL